MLADLWCDDNDLVQKRAPEVFTPSAMRRLFADVTMPMLNRRKKLRRIDGLAKRRIKMKLT